MTDLKLEDLVKLREIAEKATPGARHAAGGYLTVRDPDGASFTRKIYHLDELGQQHPWMPYQAVPFARQEDAAFHAAFDPPTVLSLLADRARMEKALERLIPLAQKWEFVESRQFSYGGGGSEPSPAEWGVEVSYQQTREAGPFEQFLADVEAFHNSADEEADPEHPEWLHDSQIARQALGASQ